MWPWSLTFWPLGRATAIGLSVEESIKMTENRNKWRKRLTQLPYLGQPQSTANWPTRGLVAMTSHGCSWKRPSITSIFLPSITWRWRYGSQRHERSRRQSVRVQGGDRHVVVGPLTAGRARRSAGDRCQPGVTVDHAVQAETSERHRRRRQTAAAGTGSADAGRDGQRQRARTSDRASTGPVVPGRTLHLRRHSSGGERPRRRRLCARGRRRLVVRWCAGGRADEMTTSRRVGVEHELELMTLTLQVRDLLLQLQLLVLQTLCLLRRTTHVIQRQTTTTIRPSKHKTQSKRTYIHLYSSKSSDKIITQKKQ